MEEHSRKRIKSSLLQHVVIGTLQREYVCLKNQKEIQVRPGGELLYTAIANRLWGATTGLLGWVGRDFPREWITEFNILNLDTKGLKVFSKNDNLCSFVSYLDPTPKIFNDPIAFFSQTKQSIPKEIIENEPKNTIQRVKRIQPETLIQIADIPQDYLLAQAVHICPQSLMNQIVLTSKLYGEGINCLTVRPHPSFMNPIYEKDLPILLRGITAFQTTEIELKNLFAGKTNNLSEMVDILSGFGCKIIVIGKKQLGVTVMDTSTRTKWDIPSYSTSVLDPLYAGAAFSGGFLAGYLRTHDPVEAGLYGCVAASFAVESFSYRHPLDVLDRLPIARLDALRNTVRKL